MNIYLVTRTDEAGWDEYEGFTVFARSHKHAVQVARDGISSPDDTWTHNITVVYLGKAGARYKVPRVILDSFNAG